MWVIFVHGQGVIGVALGREVVFDEVVVVLFLFGLLLLPFGAGFWEVAKDNFPGDFSKGEELLGETVGEVGSEFADVDYGVVEDRGEGFNALDVVLGHAR